MKYKRLSIQAIPEVFAYHAIMFYELRKLTFKQNLTRLLSTACKSGILPGPEALNKAVTADGLRDMQGLAARFLAAAAKRSPE